MAALGPSEKASSCTALNVGPMQGAQPNPKVTPKTGAPHSPAGGFAWILASPCNQLMPPRNTTPMRITTTPSTWVTQAASGPISQAPSWPKTAPMSMKTNEKPSTNSPIPANIRPRR